jgi:integrase/recombinase XerD
MKILNTEALYNTENMKERTLDLFLKERHQCSEGTKRNYCFAFKILAELTDHPFSLDREEWNEVLEKLKSRVSVQTWNAYVGMFKTFFRWQTGDKNSLDWVKALKVNRAEYIQTKLRSENEIKALIRGASSPRDRAFIAVDYATGLRRGALINIRVRDVIPRPYGYDVAAISGKTFTLQPPSITRDFAKILRVWLEHHPLREDKDAPLWPKQGDPHRSIGLTQAHLIIKKAARNAGLSRNFTLHMLRHSAATWYATHKVNEAELKLLFGWSPNSTTPNVYVHLSGGDARNASLRAQGILHVEQEKDGFEPVLCAYCGTENPSEYAHCSSCGTGLSVEEMERMVSQKQALDKIEGFFGDNPEKLKKVLEFFKAL